MKQAALIGLGMVAETHLAALRDAPSVRLRGVLGRDAAKTRAFAAHATRVTGQTVLAFGNLEALATDPSVDFVILATPPDARLDIVRRLSQAGRPMLMEKPLERDLTAARGIVEMCAAHHVPLGVVFQHRARAASRAVKNAISRGDLGQIVSAEIRVPWWRDQVYYDTPGRGTRARDGGGVMITQAIHTLDLALWFLGPIRRVQALMHRTVLHRMECKDWAGVLFETHAGCVGTLMATTAAFPGSSETLTLHGTAASAHLESGVMTLRPHDGDATSVGETASTGGGADPMAFTHSWHQSVLEDFIDSLTVGRSPLASGNDALMSHAVIDAMERSSQSGQWTEVAQI